MSGAQRRRGHRAPSPGRSSSTGEAATQSSGQASTNITVPSFDGNADPAAMALAPQVNRNVDMSVTMWAHVNSANVEIQKRPEKPSTLGKQIQVGVNTFNVVGVPTAAVYQYAVLIGDGDEKKPKSLAMKLWHSQAIKKSLPSPVRWIFDGARLAWSTEKLEREIRVNVDLDQEQGREPGRKPNVHRVVIKATAMVRFDNLRAFLDGKADFSTSCLEAINFLDHLLREGPSQNLTSIKRQFYHNNGGAPRIGLGGGVEAMKGVYQSMRIVHSATGKHTLSVNVDVANGTFWIAGPLAQLIGTIIGCGEADLANKIRMPYAQEKIRKLGRLRVKTSHRDDEYCIMRIIDQSATQHKITGGGDANGQTVAQYFQSKYNIRLRHPEWPLVKMTKGQNTLLPLEVLIVKQNQRVMGRLDENQTANMIKFAVTRPEARWGDIQKGLNMLAWDKDNYHKGYGLKISPTPVNAQARLLTAPDVVFDKNASQKPGTSGRWRVDGKRFLRPNTHPLKSWGLCIIPGGRGPAQGVAEKFISSFIQGYAGHGGVIANKSPIIHYATSADPAKSVEEVWQKAGNQSQMKPQILFFLLPTRDAMLYGRIKKSCECRFGVVSQCLQIAKAMKGDGQYISNVCLKVNAKLGGITNRAIGPTSKNANGIFKVPTMIVGADVTHPAPKSQGAPADEQMSSIAAITTSMDTLGVKYACGVNTNGYRVELINDENFTKVWKPMLREWMQNVGSGRFPNHLFYFRDGVSEGQFAGVLNQEVNAIREVLKSGNANHGVNIVVIVVTKRHHYRFFPPKGQGDRNNNALPGTLVETAITHPYENDFYLCSHAAIQGTARPAHYHVLLNEPGVPNEYIQTMIYEHCYSYVRATTPVSLFPAVYYADIAALRGKYHDRKFGSSGNPTPPSGGRQESSPRPGSDSRGTGDTGSSTPSHVDDLMEMPHELGIRNTMWYI
ncbi:Piwi domain-containing protein [Elsinoe australis]|uniref:Piwi domain-containing protein n=1 Tax=Elsinoe australis TaxID=40998 RepID=A0A4U7B5J6_9PEZI|nr:Piwi domain-containing protein [Elsinoe australis]